MSKGKPTSMNKDTLLSNVKEMLGDAETFAVEQSSELVDATFVNNEVNKIQNDVPPIAQVVVTVEDQGIVEYVTDAYSVPTNMENQSMQKKNCFLQAVLYFL